MFGILQKLGAQEQFGPVFGSRSRGGGRRTSPLRRCRERFGCQAPEPPPPAQRRENALADQTTVARAELAVFGQEGTKRPVSGPTTRKRLPQHSRHGVGAGARLGLEFFDGEIHAGIPDKHARGARVSVSREVKASQGDSSRLRTIKEQEGVGNRRDRDDPEPLAWRTCRSPCELRNIMENRCPRRPTVRIVTTLHCRERGRGWSHRRRRWGVRGREESARAGHPA